MSVLHNPRAGLTQSQMSARNQKLTFERYILDRAKKLAARPGALPEPEPITERLACAIDIPIVQENPTSETIDVVAMECNAVFVSPDESLDLGAAVDPAPVITIDRVQRAIAQEYGVTRNDLISSRRTKDIVRPRQIAMYLARHMTPRSLPEIARRFGGRDHTTALHAVRRISSLIEADSGLMIHVEYLKAKICAGAGLR